MTFCMTYQKTKLYMNNLTPYGPCIKPFQNESPPRTSLKNWAKTSLAAVTNIADSLRGA